MNSIPSFSADLHNSLSERMRISSSLIGSKAFFKFIALASCRQLAEGKACSTANSVTEATSSSFTEVMAREEVLCFLVVVMLHVT